MLTFAVNPVSLRSGPDLSLASPTSRALARCGKKSLQIRRYDHRHPSAVHPFQFGYQLLREIWLAKSFNRTYLAGCCTTARETFDIIGS